MTMSRPAEEVYAFGLIFERLREFMTWIVSVRDLGGVLSPWTVRSPVGATMDYYAALMVDVPNQRIGWSSVPCASSSAP